MPIIFSGRWILLLLGALIAGNETTGVAEQIDHTKANCFTPRYDSEEFDYVKG